MELKEIDTSPLKGTHGICCAPGLEGESHTLMGDWPGLPHLGGGQVSWGGRGWAAMAHPGDTDAGSSHSWALQPRGCWCAQPWGTPSKSWSYPTVCMPQC